eukprot:IDg956t1
MPDASPSPVRVCANRNALVELVSCRFGSPVHHCASRCPFLFCSRLTGASHVGKDADLSHYRRSSRAPTALRLYTNGPRDRLSPLCSSACALF